MSFKISPKKEGMNFPFNIASFVTLFRHLIHPENLSKPVYAKNVTFYHTRIRLIKVNTLQLEKSIH